MSDKKTKTLAIALFLITGTISTFGNSFHNNNNKYIAYKLQGSINVTEGNHQNKHFFHPYMQSLTMFIG